MRVWIIFHRELDPAKPEVPEILRFRETADRLGVELEILKPQDFELVVGTKRGWDVCHRIRKLDRPDFIIPRTGAESCYFTLAVLRHFERQGVGMVNGPDAIACVADKLHTMQLLTSEGVPIPRTILGKFPVDVDLVERELGFPVVVKTLKGTRGRGVLLCDNRSQFDDLASLLDGTKPGADFIFQRYIRASHGRDARLLVVGDKVIAAMERRSRDGNFKSNVSLGGEALAFEPPPEMADLALKVASILGLDVAGVDILFDEDGYRVCEANSSPGFQGLEKACGVDVPERIFSWLRERKEPPAMHVLSWLSEIRRATSKSYRALITHGLRSGYERNSARYLNCSATT